MDKDKIQMKKKREKQNKRVEPRKDILILKKTSSTLSKKVLTIRQSVDF